MSEYVVIVPKQDELRAVEWGFQTQFKTRDERTSSGVELYRRKLFNRDITFALLDKQTNTYSSILTAEVIARETPRLIFLTGTALGRADQVPIGSVVVSSGVVDISEKRYRDDGGSSYVTRGPLKSEELCRDASDFIDRQFTQAHCHGLIRAMARKPRLVKEGPTRVTEFIKVNNPAVMAETIVSGNEYRMTPAGQQANEIWDQVATGRAYDMEAAGFVLAAEMNGVQWLVIRGISDHGTRATKSNYHRSIAAGIAGRFLCEFLQGGLNRAEQVQLVQEPATTIPLLRDEAYRLDGNWHGVMSYLDDNGEPVVFEEHATFEQSGSAVQGLVASERLQGRPRHNNLEYRINFSITKHGYAGGIWSETVAARQYFGVVLGQLNEDSQVLSGAWLGTHRGGVRKGYFKWYNIERDDSTTDVVFDIGKTNKELIAAFVTRATRPGPLAL